jgi:glycosyltransferase involved in cell wall biosynthesis
MEIISIITTKNRPNFLEKALYSIKNQKRYPNIIILVTDSNETNIEKEKNIIKNFDLIYLTNEFNKNYAGSLNTAIHYLLNCKYNKSINEKINKLNLDFENTYIAILDDDDEWNYDYLYELESKMNGEDFCIAGLIYKNEEGEKELSIPNELSIHDFLRTNPHIQGSNTFVKLKTLLKAGLFDENMNSTTDRDIFTRILMLNPTYKVINKYLVNINAEMNRSRITNNEKIN